MPVIEIEYFKASTPVHRLHPLTKMFFQLCVFVMAGAFNSPLYLAGLILAIIAVAALAKVPARKFKYMWVVAYIVTFLIFTQGIWFTSFGNFGGVETAFEWRTLVHLWPGWLPGGPKIPLTLEGAVWGLSLGLRMTGIALAFPISIMSTHPSDLVIALAEIRIGSWRLPYNLIFVFASALRYIPSISREFDHTIDAQRARGVEFEGYNVLNQLRAVVPLFVPIITSSLVHAQDLTIALETRAFGATENRTFVREVKWQAADTSFCLILIAITAACVVAARWYGLGMLPFTPQGGF